MLKTIIVALDCSETSDLLIKALDNLQILPHTKIVLSHVVTNKSVTEQELDRPQDAQETIYQKLEKQLHIYQKQLPNCEIELISGDPAEEILRIANIYKADLIVMGTRGIKGFQRILLTSVSSQVVAEAPCSVLVVKP